MANEIEELIRDQRLYFVGDKLPGDYYEAFKMWFPLAQEGDAKAQYNIARSYNNGDGVDKSNEKAFEWYSKAFSQGDPRATHNLALMYQDGEFVDVDLHRSRELMLKAAELGDRRAQFNAGQYAFGEGDKSRAKELFKKSLDAGFYDAKAGLIACDLDIVTSMQSRREKHGIYKFEYGYICFFITNNSKYDVDHLEIQMELFGANLETKIEDKSVYGNTLASGQKTELTFCLYTKKDKCRAYYYYFTGISVNGVYFALNRTLVYTPKKSMCFVVTACYGDEMDPTVLAYRDFRDNHLAKYSAGRYFIAWYYRHGPRLARMIEGKPKLLAAGRAVLSFIRTKLPR